MLAFSIIKRSIPIKAKKFKEKILKTQIHLSEEEPSLLAFSQKGVLYLQSYHLQAPLFLVSIQLVLIGHLSKRRIMLSNMIKIQPYSINRSPSKHSLNITIMITATTYWKYCDYSTTPWDCMDKLLEKNYMSSNQTSTSSWVIRISTVSIRTSV